MLKYRRKNGKMNAFEIVMQSREALVNKIIENMENGYILPREQWNRNVFNPQNPLSEAVYHGVNRFRLMYAAMEHCYEDPRWVTYKQAKEAGLKFKKYDRDKGVLCEKWIFTRKEIVKEENEFGEIEKKEKEVLLSKPMVNYFTVYNAQEFKNFPSLDFEWRQVEENQVVQLTEEIISVSECPIKEIKQGRAYYSPAEDKIILPPRETFINDEAFLGTMLHEMAHSTGHVSRLNRSIMNEFGSQDYAKEELRAEMAAIFMEGDFHVKYDMEHFNNHTQYLESWIGALKQDKNELFRAISDAQKASERIVGNYEKKYGPLKKEEKLVRDVLKFEKIKKVKSRKGKSR